jgi:uncharacterized membrane protein
MQKVTKKLRKKKKKKKIAQITNDQKKITITFHSYQQKNHKIFRKIMAIVAPAIFHPKFFILIFNIIINFSMTCSMSEAEALLSLKNSFSNSEALDNWIANTFPCTEDDQWAGVVCYNGLVTGLRLGGMGLFGKINVDALLELKGLRTISLMNNSFTGSIPELNRIGFLKAMYLSGNKFSGNIPQEYFQRMKSLKKVWLSNNEFTGVIPSSLTEIPQLVELHLENNQFSGNIPNFSRPSLVKINLSNNNLEGEVPEGLMRFNQSSFQGNSGLCGEKIGTICGKPMEQPNPIGAHNMNNMTELKNNNNNVYVSMADKSKHKSLQIIGIIVTSIVLISLAIFLFMKSRKKKEKVEYDDEIGENNGQESINDIGSVEVQVTSSSNSISTSTNHVKKSPSSRKNSSHASKGMGELMMMNDDKGVFGLPDLMKASAEVLGNGGFGSSYKAVMSNGLAVVVKRTRELNGLGKDGFEAEMKRLGRVKHWNVLTPLAYHYRKDEKLVISEYVPRGSLLYLLHGKLFIISINYLLLGYIAFLASYQLINLRFWSSNFHNSTLGPLTEFDQVNMHVDIDSHATSTCLATWTMTHIFHVSLCGKTC